MCRTTSHRMTRKPKEEAVRLHLPKACQSVAQRPIGRGVTGYDNPASNKSVATRHLECPKNLGRLISSMPGRSVRGRLKTEQGNLAANLGDPTRDSLIYELLRRQDLVQAYGQRIDSVRQFIPNGGNCHFHVCRD